MKITNTGNIKKQFEIGLVTGEFVSSRIFYKDWFNSIRNFLGWPLVSYAQMLSDCKDEALKEMIKDAEKLEATGIINVRFAITVLTNDSAVVLVSGTAVK
jgi:uncharacterized protein YbjQ (UPF0145 family)